MSVNVIKLAKEIVKNIKLYCKKIEIVGSIRRHEENPKDIDIVLIPKNKEKIEEILIEKGKKIMGGDKKTVFLINGINVELYYTVEKEWGAALVAYSSKKGAEIGLRVIAKKRGFKLNQYGLFKNNKFVAGRTEKDIYKKLKRKLKRPENR